MGRLAAMAVTAWAAGWAFAAPAAPDEPAAATVRHASDDRSVSVALPAPWKVARARDVDAALALESAVPGCSAPVALDVYHLPGMLDARGQPYVERSVHPGRFGVRAAALAGQDPAPHVLLDVPEGGRSVRHAWIYRVVRRNGYTLHAACAAEDWPRLRDDLFRAALSLESAAGEWPPPPAGYRRTERDGYVVYAHPSATAAHVEAVRRGLLHQEADFAKVHGAVRKLAESPPVVVVLATKEDARAVSLDAAQRGVYAELNPLRLFAVPPAKDDARAEAEFALEAWELLLTMHYGPTAPLWLVAGESRAAAIESELGKSLPNVPESLRPWLPSTLRPFGETLAAESASAEDAGRMTVWTAFFRCGPKPYRDAYAAYLRRCAADGDCETAAREHLLSLDQTKLLAAAEAFAAKGLKTVKER